MNIPDLKQLDKLIALCRKRGVKVIKLDNMELTLSDDAPSKPSKRGAKDVQEQASSIFESDTLTDEQLLGWSVMDIPALAKPGAQDEGTA